MGTLYLVATPIGNLEDITLRALRILRTASLIAAEDTRVTRKLLEHFQIRAQMVSYHEHNKLSQIDKILAALEQGDVAVVSDAGTPGLNDPGYELVQAALAAGVPVSPIPGPASPVAALTGSGLPSDSFLYLGYLPRKGAERRKRIEAVRQASHTLIFLEAPHRLLAALADLHVILGNRPAAAARELTKLHEEFVRGTLQSIQAHFSFIEPRGEFCLVVAGCSERQAWGEAQVVQALRERGEEPISAGALSAEIAEQAGWRKNDVYRILLELKKGTR